MSDLRKAAEAALEALEMEATSPPITETGAAIEALRAALAQPDEKKIGCVQHDCADCQARALAQPEQLVVGGDDLPTLTKWTPQRKPLAGEKLEAMYEDYATHGDIVRAIEKAHGIR